MTIHTIGHSTRAFDEADIAELMAWGRDQPTASMGAEGVWWRCHRPLIADALIARDVEVRHILTRAEPQRHGLTEFGRIAEGQVTYPGADLKGRLSNGPRFIAHLAGFLRTNTRITLRRPRPLHRIKFLTAF
jgi:hypothetical protein